MSRPRLLVVGPTPPPVHGTSVYTRMLLDSAALADAFDVRHLDISDRRSLENIGRLDPTNVWLGLKHLAGMAAAVLRHRPDVVYVEVSQNALAYFRDACFIAVARLGGARVVTHLHGGHFGTFYRDATPLVRTLVRASSRQVDRAWVLGEGLRHHYDGLLPPEAVRVVANGVPDPLTALPAVDDPPPGPPMILYLGQLSLPKGVLDLVEAVALLDADPAPRLVLAGGWASGAERRWVEAKVRALGLRVGVEVPGVVRGQAKAALLAEADVFVLPTAYPYEGQPLSILEAMAAGLPVVSTARGAIPDMVRDGVTGLLVAERDPQALSGALASLLADPPLRRRMGEAGRALWAERFTEAACVGRFVAELRDLLAAPAAASSEDERGLIDPAAPGTFPP